MRKSLMGACLGLVVALGAAAPAQAQITFNGDEISTRPAATLLLPYFEVDYTLGTNPNHPRVGINTIFTVGNASATAVLAHVTIWSATSVPVFSYNVYLTGYDILTYSLRDLIVDGKLPKTASDGQDPGDVISPQGPVSQDINFASCTTGGLGKKLPGRLQLTATEIDDLRKALDGGSPSTYGGKCASQGTTGIARGYITVNTVNQCQNTMTPADPGYYTAPVITYQNVLYGDFNIVDVTNNLAQGDTLVHIQSQLPNTFVPGSYTFYGRYVGWNGSDARQPLATTFAAPYSTVAAQPTDLLVWRDSKRIQKPFVCGTPPTELTNEQLAAFDQEERVVALSGRPFPNEAQRVRASTLGIPFSAGWLFMNLNHNKGPVQPTDNLAAQAWVVVVAQVNGLFSAGHQATALDSAGAPNHLGLGPIPPLAAKKK